MGTHKRNFSVDEFKTPEKPVIYRNYLKELKKYGSLKKFSSWKKDMKDESLNDSQKYERVYMKAGLLDKDALVKEKYLKYYQNDMEIREKLNEMYYSAIEAKLALLKNL